MGDPRTFAIPILDPDPENFAIPMYDSDPRKKFAITFAFWLNDIANFHLLIYCWRLKTVFASINTLASKFLGSTRLLFGWSRIPAKLNIISTIALVVQDFQALSLVDQVSCQLRRNNMRRFFSQVNKILLATNRINRKQRSKSCLFAPENPENPENRTQYSVERFN